jgi:predicted nucleotidyltransferase
MIRLPRRAESLLESLTERLPTLLEGNLVGVYLYGSITQGAFDPRRSDVDCIVVTSRDLSNREFNDLRGWFRSMSSNPWMKRLQISFLIRDQVLTMNAKACNLQFGELKRCGSDGNPIIWMNVLASGMVLHGEAPKSFVPPISAKIFDEALVREIGYLREEISTKKISEWRDNPKYRIYAVLTICRILYSFARGTIVSKPVAARWARRNLPREFSSLIDAALDPDRRKTLKQIRLDDLERFIKFAEETFSKGLFDKL